MKATVQLGGSSMAQDDEHIVQRHSSIDVHFHCYCRRGAAHGGDWQDVPGE